MNCGGIGSYGFDMPQTSDPFLGYNRQQRHLSLDYGIAKNDKMWLMLMIIWKKQVVCWKQLSVIEFLLKN